MRNHYSLLYIVAASLCCATAKAQKVTYNHDASKMNQFTVAEIGAGGLTPPFYYDMFHSSYQKSAEQKNKLGYRSATGLALYQQIEMAEKLDSAMRARATIEALNVADRSGGVLDLAWLAEKDKLTNKIGDYERNIGRILQAGGTVNSQQHWKEYLDMFRCAIKATQDAYMPNAQRKKQYLSIYADVCRKNEQLVHYIVQLSNARSTRELLGASYEKPHSTAMIVAEAMGRWRDAGWSTIKPED